jgi:hypothetical protein
MASETSSVTKPILEALNRAGYFCMRMNSGMVRMGNRYIRLCPAGTADLMLCLPDRLPVWLECKTAKGKTNPEQVEAQNSFRLRVEALGHIYLRVDSLDDVLRAI